MVSQRLSDCWYSKSEGEASNLALLSATVLASNPSAKGTMATPRMTGPTPHALLIAASLGSVDKLRAFASWLS